jgi:predicted SAM-dependent methyltransferase
MCIDMSSAAAAGTANELKLNIGCGTSGIAGWCNIDNSPTVLLSRIPLGRWLFGTPAWPPDVRRIDAVRGMPFADSTVSYIYSSHMLQGLIYEDSLLLIKESFRVLRPGGVLRIAVPDLARMIEDYLSDNDVLASHKLMRRLSFKSSAIRDLLRKRRGYQQSYRQLFDGRSLKHLFNEGGFKNPEVCGFRESRIPEIDAIEVQQRRKESLYVEASK